MKGNEGDARGEHRRNVEGERGEECMMRKDGDKRCQKAFSDRQAPQ